MYRNERLTKIMEIVASEGSVTVKRLVIELGYATATINRDLNILEKNGLIKRSYGCVQLEGSQTLPSFVRSGFMDREKNELARRAADFINDNDTVFIDASTTTQAIGKYITEKENITVITNNALLFVYLSEHNVKAILLGGEPGESVYYLGGVDAEASAMKYEADKLFFSASKISTDARIQADRMYETLRLIMLKNSKEAYFLIDKTKVDLQIKKTLTDTNRIKGIISDFEFSSKVKDKYSGTSFINV